ncbi:unnamed protein product [Trichogramma brassicae]|uniref:Endonuclease/exonuclease/phosphatase domain-containing protein n=1 Tax=Trichogramma brassicae TaxID=86971 RepID=A0A6H5HX38_9HYME|nr:unnamed protein product [Trichogramma brassicae]
MRILQLNLNHCRSAQNLLSQTVRELGINVAIVCDQYKNPGPHYTWIADSNRQAAIWVRGGLPVQDRPSRPLPFFTWARVSDVYIFSVYAPPRLSNAEFSALLANVVEEAQHQRPLIIAGDFNAWSTEWGSSETKTPRRVALLDALSALNVVLLNTGHTPTFTGRAGQLHHRPLLRQRLAHSQSGGVAGGEGGLHEQRSPSHHLQPERTQASQKLGGPETEMVRPQAGCGGLLRAAVQGEDPERERDARAPGGHGGCSHHRHHRSLQRVDAQRGRAPPPPRARVLVDGRDRRSLAAVLAGSKTCPKSAGACRGGGSTRRFRHREEPTARCHRGEQAPLLERPLQ